MSRNKKNVSSIKTVASINQIKLKKGEHVLSFSSLKIAEGDSEFVQDVVDNESLLEVAISYPGKPDKKFPPIACQCGMKGFSIKKTVDVPQFVNMKFSGNQVDQLRNIMETETEINLAIKRLQGTFNFEEPEPD